MSYTLGTARTELFARGFDYLGTPRANTFLEEANQELNEMSAWPWLEATTTGTGTVAVSDLRDVLYVLDTTNQNQLEPADIRDLVEIDANFQTTTGTPTNYYLDNN